MRRSLTFALIGTICLSTSAHACQPFGGFFGRILHPCATARACCSTRTYATCTPAPAAACYSAPQQTVYAAPQAPAKTLPQPVPPAKSTPQTSGTVVVPVETVVVIDTDPYGFQVHLNACRAQYGLRPLRFSRNLAAWAYQNSLAGFGHRVRFARRQNAALGQPTAYAVAQAWMGSPGHASAMLDVSATEYGIALVAGVWTLEIQ